MEEVGDDLADVGQEEGIEEREMLGVFYENDFEEEQQENDSATDENNETNKQDLNHEDNTFQNPKILEERTHRHRVITLQPLPGYNSEIRELYLKLDKVTDSCNRLKNQKVYSEEALDERGKMDELRGQIAELEKSISLLREEFDRLKAIKVANDEELTKLCKKYKIKRDQLNLNQTFENNE